MEIKVKYFDDEMPKLEQTEKGDWIDLRVREVYVCPNTEWDIKNAMKERKMDEWNDSNTNYYRAGDVLICRLGVAMELPIDKKANIYARSSLFATYGLLLTNAVGCVDNIYKGDNDEWLAVFYATRSGYIKKYERVVQFDVVNRTKMSFAEVEKLGDDDRGGYGSTGRI